MHIDEAKGQLTTAPECVPGVAPSSTYIAESPQPRPQVLAWRALGGRSHSGLDLLLIYIVMRCCSGAMDTAPYSPKPCAYRLQQGAAHDDRWYLRWPRLAPPLPFPDNGEAWGGLRNSLRHARGTLCVGRSLARSLGVAQVLNAHGHNELR